MNQSLTNTEQSSSELSPVVREGFDSLRRSFGFILKSPQLLGRFLGLCAALKPLEKQARRAARDFAEGGQSIPGCTYQEGRIVSHISAEGILEAARGSDPETELANLKTFVHLVAPISGNIYADFCQRIGVAPTDKYISRERTSSYVVVRKAGALPNPSLVHTGTKPTRKLF